MSAKILVIDDEKRICHNVKKILAKSNFEVTEAQSAREALEKMSEKNFSLLISDIVMPEMNGLELLKRVKNEWPATRVIMMTAYASTDTAVKAIRLGALDYIPKPFTPNELRDLVNQAVSGEILENPAPEAERKEINVIDNDMPFDADTVAKYTGEEYVKTLGPSDMPIVPVSMPEALENYCETGKRVCDIFKKLKATCKAGVKKGICPKKAAEDRKKAAKPAGPDVRTLVGIDMPFSYDDVISVTGPEYVANLHHEGVAFVPYEKLKKNIATLEKIRTAEAKTAKKDDITGHMESVAPGDILVIDDEVSVNNNIRKILAKKGYGVDQATTKQEALEKIAGQPYKLVLLDLKIPGARGLELLKAIRDKRPETKVIIITGYATIETAVQGARMGVVEYVNKPFTPNEIRKATDNAMRFAA